jgi:hypothetical protein
MRTETEQQAVTTEEWNERLGIAWGEKLVEYFGVFHSKEPWRLSPANDEDRARAEKALTDIGIAGRVKVISVRRTRHVLNHHNMRQRRLQNKISNALSPHIPAEVQAIRLDFFLQRTFSRAAKSIFACLRESPWGTAAYLSVETLDVVGRCLIGLVASGTEEMAKKTAAIMNLFAFGNPLVDEFDTDFYPLLEE